MIGPWHEMQQLAARLKQDFDAYVAENPEIHFSAGLVMTKPAVPAKTLSQLAEEALGDAKSAGKIALRFSQTLSSGKTCRHSMISKRSCGEPSMNMG